LKFSRKEEFVAETVKRVYEFGEFRLYVEERLLLRGRNPLPLTPKLFDALLFFVQNSGHLLLKDELMKQLWPDSFVEEVNLSQSISRLRKILGETASRQYIATVAGQGYRFVAEVKQVANGQETADALVIESHTRERVVVEEEGGPEADRLMIGHALPARTQRRRKFWLIPLVLGLAALVWLARPPKPPRLLAATQITNDGLRKWQGYSGPLLLTDGSRIYTVEDKGAGSMASTLVQVPVSGGETIPIPVPFPLIQITDLDRWRSEMLLLSWSGAAELDAPLWAYSLLNGDYRRVGDLKVSDATWAADGSIIFTRGTALWSAGPDGSQPQLLARFEGIPGAPRESPDQRVIRFTLADPQTHSTSLWEVSRNGQNPHPLLSSSNGQPRECCGSWTPDGRYYVFQSLLEGRWGIWALREKSRLIWKDRGPFELTTGPIDYVAPTPSLDGKKLFAVGLQSRSELLRLDPAKKLFAPFLPKVPAASIDFSGDGNWAAYVSGVDGQLWRSRSDGTDRQQLTYPPTIVAMPTWSPDGKWIAFMAGLPGKTWKIYVVSGKGGPATELLSESADEFDPTWSPDGRRLAFGRRVWGTESAESRPALYIVDLETREVSKISGSDGLFSPRWSRGGQLAAVSADSKRLMLYDSKKHNWGELVSGGVAFPRWSHDDKYIYLDTTGNDRFVCRVDIHSRKTERIASLENLRPGGILGAWSGLAPDDSPMFVRDAGSYEIYAFDLGLP